MNDDMTPTLIHWILALLIGVGIPVALAFVWPVLRRAARRAGDYVTIQDVPDGNPERL